MERLNISIDIACALDYLHHDSEIPVVHCDLKPTNILLDEDMTAKVGDFGLAKLLMEKRGTQSASITSSAHVLNGSVGYIPPEYGFGEKPSTGGDVYSFGVMLLEIFTGKSPTNESFNGEVNIVKWVEATFPDKVQLVLEPELLHINPEIPQDCLITIIGVGLSCTTHSPDCRISIRDALRNLKSAKHVFLKQLPIQQNKY
ncbi:hypothetical protein Ddye_001014 [Dipteronia dyeriana]|uniref:non-specific serine/threonine protein kinase n=1 Tax=Dipteronia dyeriana TaxID=168575 RepID=A0AAE0CSX0_9ROSI|nr:hypothetical protein Ddye_001014 [Dipteronia dyeriana]